MYTRNGDDGVTYMHDTILYNSSAQLAYIQSMHSYVTLQFQSETCNADLSIGLFRERVSEFIDTMAVEWTQCRSVFRSHYDRTNVINLRGKTYGSVVYKNMH